jgi:4-aminobutyrate aminotransferase
MISEAELEKLSFPEAPRMLTRVPGPKVQKIMAESARYEAISRGGGNFPPIMEDSRGSTVKDADGNVYIDISAGMAVNSVGHNHPRVLEAIRHQITSVIHTADFTNPKRIELAKRISGIMPGSLRGNCQTVFTHSGSDAVETAIKFARHFTGRSQIIAFHGAYHGVWCGTAALTTGYRYRHGWGPLIPGVIHLPYAYCYRCEFNMTYPGCDLQCAKYIDNVLNTPYTAADDVAAIIVETQQGEGGFVAPPIEFFQLIKKGAEKYGALYIADEVQTGAGRTGRMWAIEHTGVTPDILTWGNGMGGDMPMAGATFRTEIGKTLVEGSQPVTFGGNAVSCAVTLANIDLLEDREMDLLARASHLGEELRAKLNSVAGSISRIGEVRGRGLMLGIELVSDKTTRDPLPPAQCEELATNLLNQGVVMVLCGRWGNVLRFMPPLTITRELAFKAMDIIIEELRRSA